MIKEFSFGNYRSFKEIQSLNMTASKINELTENNIIVLNEKQSLLKSKAIYGANASGKSNIVKALVSFIKIIKNSVKDEKVLDLIENFKLSVDTDNEPSFFQLIFEINKIQFRYGFEVTDKVIKSEWLFGVPNEREVCYFVSFILRKAINFYQFTMTAKVKMRYLDPILCFYQPLLP
jgi:AAA15 family ATPase/GTPase